MSYSSQIGGASSLPARWYCDSATPFKGCQCLGSGCQQCHGGLYSCGAQPDPALQRGSVTENFTVNIPTNLRDLRKQVGQTLENVGGIVSGKKDKQGGEGQDGGAIRFPARYFHPEATPFKGCQCANANCASSIYSCGGGQVGAGCGCAGLADQVGGAHNASSAIPAIQYGTNEPINPQALTLSQKAAQQGNSQFAYYNAYSQQPCQCFEDQYKYYGDFNRQNCGSRAAQVAGLAWSWPRQRPVRPEDAQLGQAEQEGGSGSVGAPFSIWTQGEPLKQSYPQTEGPLFVPIQRSCPYM